MPQWSRSNDRSGRALDDAGSAAIEFIFVGLILLVPIVYLVITLGAVQHQALGAESGARYIARAVAASEDAADADLRAQQVMATVVAEYDFDPGASAVEVICTGTTSGCPEAGATVVVTVRTDVALPLVPPILGLDHLARIPVEATAVQKVSRFWGAE
ncbi:TadE family protein [Microbacterium sp. P04]|uniref:TadE family protein n=1 Tax=Microbacterium sp. P04 TaxID=3366947 RepID=UPI00374602EE